MKRREFLSNSLLAAAGSTALLAGNAEKISANTVPPARKTNHQQRQHPLYFDGLSFLGEQENEVKNSGLSGFIWDVSKGAMIDGKYVRQFDLSLKSIANANRVLRTNDQGMFLATKGSHITEAYASGKTGVFLQFQSADTLAEDLNNLDVFYELGLRMMQLTHHYDNPYSGGALEKEYKGLTDLGRKTIEKMNTLGIIPDLSHGNEVMSLEILKISKRPVIISHTGSRALVNNARCVPDSVIKAVADSGGIIGIFAMSFWLTEDDTATIDAYIKQLEHVINVGGIDAVGIANDYTLSGQLDFKRLNNSNEETVKLYLPWWKQHDGVLGFDKIPKHVVIPELNTVRRLFTIHEALEKRKFSAGNIEKIVGKNWVRVLTECLG